jgi:hypothetical protein
MHNSDTKKTSRLSKAHVAKLFQESHFQHATAHMNPIAKAFLEFYLNVAKSVETFSEYVEDLLTASQSAECAHISEASIEKLAVVANAVNEMHEDCEKAKQDLWLLVGHASAGNHLHKLFYQDESMEVLDLKVDDPRIEKLAKEVDAGKKAAATAAAKAKGNANPSRGRGASRGRGSRFGSRNSYPSRDTSSNGGQYQYNNFRGAHHNNYRGGFRGGFGSGNFHGNYQNHQAGTLPQNGPNQQNGQGTFPTKMLGWFPSGP